MLPSSHNLEACLQQVLDAHSPWSVCKVEFGRSEQLPRNALHRAGPYACPVCGAAARV